MHKISTAAVGVVAAVLLLSGCGEQTTPERLNALLENGPEAERTARANEQLARLLGRNSATGALAGPYGGQDDGTGADLASSLSLRWNGTPRSAPLRRR